MDVIHHAPPPRTTPRDRKEPLPVWRTEPTAIPSCLSTPT